MATRTRPKTYQERAYPYFSLPLFPESDSVRIYEGRYVNTMGVGVSIVAVVNHQYGDWAAYIGGSTDGSHSERQSMLKVAASGVKMRKEDGQHFFPLIKETWRA